MNWHSCEVGFKINILITIKQNRHKATSSKLRYSKFIYFNYLSSYCLSSVHVAKLRKRLQIILRQLVFNPTCIRNFRSVPFLKAIPWPGQVFCSILRLVGRPRTVFNPWWEIPFVCRVPFLWQEIKIYSDNMSNYF